MFPLSIYLAKTDTAQKQGKPTQKSHVCLAEVWRCDRVCKGDTGKKLDQGFAQNTVNATVVDLASR